MFDTDPDQMELRLSQWAQGFADQADRFHRMRAQVEQIRVTDSSPDGAVRVTVDSSGALTDALREGWADGEQWRKTVAAAGEFAEVDEVERDRQTDQVAARYMAETGGHAVMLLQTGEFYVGIEDD